MSGWSSWQYRMPESIARQDGRASCRKVSGPPAPHLRPVRGGPSSSEPLFNDPSGTLALHHLPVRHRPCPGERPHLESSVTRIASILRACARSMTRWRTLRLVEAPKRFPQKLRRFHNHNVQQMRSDRTPAGHSSDRRLKRGHIWRQAVPIEPRWFFVL